MASELGQARARIAALEALCADVYQLAAAVGAPLPLLDALWAAQTGAPLAKDVNRAAYGEMDCTEVQEREAVLANLRQLLGVSAAAELGRVGGAKTSKAKQLAARANGKKGGRPRKVA